MILFIISFLNFFFFLFLKWNNINILYINTNINNYIISIFFFFFILSLVSIFNKSNDYIIIKETKIKNVILVSIIISIFFLILMVFIFILYFFIKNTENNILFDFKVVIYIEIPVLNKLKHIDNLLDELNKSNNSHLSFTAEEIDSILNNKFLLDIKKDVYLLYFKKWTIEYLNIDVNKEYDSLYYDKFLLVLSMFTKVYCRLHKYFYTTRFFFLLFIKP